MNMLKRKKKTTKKVEEVKEVKPKKKDTRECTCGKIVILPLEGEEPVVCKCGVKHAR